MTNQHPQRHTPQRHIDFDRIAQLVIEATSQSCCPEGGTRITRLAVVIAELVEEVTEAYSALAESRMEAANLRAAMQAALGADREGEPDPLAYLRYELPDDGRKNR